MTQEEKDLLIKDLCARLFFGVKVLYNTQIFEVQYIEPMYEEIKLLDNENYTLSIDEVKPYLFPLSSMTEEQYKYISYNFGRDGLDYIKYGTCDFHSSTLNIEDIYELVDWLNENHFDYRGLIEKSLALDATEKRVYEFKLIEK